MNVQELKVDLTGKTSVAVGFRIRQVEHLPPRVASHFRDPEEKQRTQKALQNMKGRELFSIPVQQKRIAPPLNFFAFMNELGFMPGGADYDYRTDEHKTFHMVRVRFYRDPTEALDLETAAIFEAALKEMSETALWGVAAYDNGANIAFNFTDRMPLRRDDGSFSLARPDGTPKRERDTVKPVPLTPSLIFKADSEAGVISLVVPA